jgi:hypothetical protein
MDNVDNSIGAGAIVHKVIVGAGLYVAIIALIVGCLCLGFQLSIPSLIDAKVNERMSELKADLAEKSADTKASVLAARQDARIALDKVEQTQVQLGAKGLVSPSTH